MVSIISLFIGIAAWDFVTDLVNRAPILGWIKTALIALFFLVLLAITLREPAAFSRLRRVDRIQAQAVDALADSNLKAARTVTAQMAALYAGRDNTSGAWPSGGDGCGRGR